MAKALIKVQRKGMPTSKYKQSIAEVLKNEGYISDWRVEGEGVKKDLVIDLKILHG